MAKCSIGNTSDTMQETVGDGLENTIFFLQNFWANKMLSLAWFESNCTCSGELGTPLPWNNCANDESKLSATIYWPPSMCLAVMNCLISQPSSPWLLPGVLISLISELIPSHSLWTVLLLNSEAPLAWENCWNSFKLYSSFLPLHAWHTNPLPGPRSLTPHSLDCVLSFHLSPSSTTFNFEDWRLYFRASIFPFPGWCLLAIGISGFASSYVP